MTDTPKRRGRPPTKPAKPAHKRWEYTRVVLLDAESDLNIYGAHGWELTVIYTIDEPGRAPVEIAVFKRELV